MTIGFIDFTTHTRKEGHSVAAALAYRGGLKLADCRTGELHDHTHRDDGDEVAGYGIESARPSPLAADEQTLADAMEHAERRKDSRIARAGILNIPYQLDDDAKLNLARDIAHKVADHLETIAAWALHPPSAKGDQRNWHAHLIIPTRHLTENGQELGAKMARLDNQRTSGDEVAALRNLIGDTVNEHLRRANLDTRMDVGQRLDIDAKGDSLSADVVNLARRRTEKRTGRQLKGIPARQLVATAVANGDIDPGPDRQRRRGRDRSAAQSGPARYERHARSRRARAAEDQAAVQEMAQEPPTAAPGAEPAPEDPEEPQTRTRRSRSRQKPAAEDGRSRTPTGERKRRRRAPRGDPGTAAPEPSPEPAPDGQLALEGLDDEEPNVATLDAELAELEAIGDLASSKPREPDEQLDILEDKLQDAGEKARDDARAELEQLAQDLAPAKSLELLVQERIDQARNWAVQVTTATGKPAELDIHARRRLDAEAERRQTLQQWARPPLHENNDGQGAQPMHPFERHARALQQRDAEAQAPKNLEEQPPVPDPPRAPVQAHADTHGQPPAKAPLQDASAFERERKAKREAAWKDRLGASVRNGAEAMGEAMIHRHAGNANAYPTLADTGNEARKAAEAALALHVRPYLVPERHRRTGYDRERVHSCIERWRNHFKRHAPRIIAELVARVWPEYLREQQHDFDQAKASVTAEKHLDEARREWRRKKESARARHPATPGPDRGAPGRD